MATGRVLNAANNSSFSINGGFRSIFSCCFATPIPNSTTSRRKEGENEESSDEVFGPKSKDEVDDKADAAGDVREEGRSAGREEEFSQHRRIRNPSEQDSAIDSGSLNSQFNLRGSVEGDTMKTGDDSEPDEETSHHGNQNDDITKQYATKGEQESNDDDTILHATSPIFKTGEEEGGEGVVEADANNLLVAETEVDDQSREADRAHPPAIQCGRVRMTFAYDVGHQRLTVTVNEASDIPDPDRVNLSHSQIHLLLLPNTKKIRHRTKAKTGENPKFEDIFRIKISTDELEGNGVRLRLYRSEKFKKERMIGENYVAFSSIPFDQGAAAHSIWIKLQPRININIIGSPTSNDAVEMDINNADGMTASSLPAAAAATVPSGGHPLELMLGMAYNATTGRLSVEVVQGCNIKSPDSQKPPDTYVKLRMIAPNGQEITRCKTSIRRSQPNPLYKETFMFHVPEFQLPDVSLMVSVFEHRNLKHNKMLGWFTLGHTNSTEETKKHWMAMIASKGEQIARWHTLLNP